MLLRCSTRVFAVSSSAARGGPQHIPRPADARPGGPPPWQIRGQLPDLDEICRRVRAHRPGVRFTGAPPPKRNSAVLIPLFERNSETHVVLTTRSVKLRSHTGEVSFPGGRQDDGETLEVTALREAEEEIALDRRHVEIVGELDRLSTFSSKSAIHPFVGRIDDLPDLVANPDEVDRILLVPFSELISPDVYREERWSSGVYGHERAMHFFELVGDTVWGATAAMLHQLLDVALD